MPCRRQHGMPGLRRAPRVRTGGRGVQSQRFVACYAREQPAFVMSDWRTLERHRIVEMTERRELDVFKTHVWPAPVRSELSAAATAFRRAHGLKRGLGREVRFADQCSRVTRARQSAGESAPADGGIEIDAVVPYAMRKRQLSGQNRSARRLAHEIRRNARR